MTLDTTRADRLGCYGRVDAATPHLDSLAERGARFDSAHTTAPLTLPAHASLFTGTWPAANGVRDNGAFLLAPQVETLAEVLREEGYDTAAVVAAFPLDRRFGLDQGFATYDQIAAPADGPFYAERDAASVTAAATAWLAQRGDGPFLLWAHYFDPHHPYEPPPEHLARAGGDPYQGELAAVDDALGTLLAALPEGTLVVVAGDHGEGLGERGEATHGALLYAGTTRVPLLVAGPGVPAGAVVAAPVGLADVMPTVLELIGRPPARGVQGRSLVPHLRGEVPDDHAVVLETLYPRLHCRWSALFALVEGHYKLVVATDSDAQPELFDLSEDPGERVDVADEHAGVVAAMRARLDALLRDAARDAPVSERAVDGDEAAALAHLGYAAGGGGGQAGERLPHPAPGMPLFNLVLPAHVLTEAGDHAGAEELLAAAEGLDPDAYVVLRGRTHQLLAAGRSDPSALQRARETGVRAAGLAPGDSDLQRWLVEICSLQGDYPEALRRLDLAGVSDDEALFVEAKLYARALEEQGKVREALSLWEVLAARRPEAPGPRTRRDRLRDDQAP